MAVSRPTPRDIGSYEAKLMGPFTQRQCICLAAGIVPSVLVCWVLKTLGSGMYIMVATVMTIMLIPCCLAFGKKFTYGQNPEDFFKDYLYYHVQCSRVRYYEVDSFDDVAYRKVLKEREKNITKNKKKEREPDPGRETKYINKDKFRTYYHKKDKDYNEL